jgi:hypothetical protein
MATMTRPRAAVKPRRSIRLILDPTPTMDGIVRITAGRTVTDYFLRCVPRPGKRNRPGTG